MNENARVDGLNSDDSDSPNEKVDAISPLQTASEIQCRSVNAVKTSHRDDSDSSDIDDDESSDDEINQPNKMSWKSRITEHAKTSFLERRSSSVNLQELVYGRSAVSVVSEGSSNAGPESENDESSDEDDNFFKLKKSKNRQSGVVTSFQPSGSNLSSLLHENDSLRAASVGDIEDFDVAPWLEEGEDCLV